MAPRLHDIVARSRWAIIALHLLFLALLAGQQGVLDDKEALKYIGAAQDLLNGDGTDLLGRYRAYGGYILFLVPFVAVGLPTLAVGAQIAMGIAAAMALDRLVVRYSGSRVAGRMAMAVYLLAHPIQQWTLSLYSEGLFVPLVVVFLERALRPGAARAPLALLALLTVFTRPTGILFVAPALLLSRSGPCARAMPGVRWTATAALVPAMLFLPALNREQLAVVAGSHVICGMPEHGPDAALFAGRTLAEAQAFVVDRHEAAYWASLGLRRLASLFNPQRTYHSGMHNLLSALVLLLYPLALIGARHVRRSDALAVLSAALVLNALLIALTYDEWNGRFLAPLLPAIIFFAAIGARQLGAVLAPRGAS